MSALGPIDPTSVQNEDRKEAAWIVRKLAGVDASISSIHQLDKLTHDSQ